MNERKTKIVCTMGPATENIEVLRELANAGMNVARFNFSHDIHENHGKRITLVKAVREEMNIPIALLLDTKGPEIRLKTFENGKIKLIKGRKFTLTSEDIIGNEKRASVTFKDLPLYLTQGNKLLINDGLIVLRVDNINGTEIECTVIVGGEVSNSKSINVPNVNIDMPCISKNDEKDILFGIANDIDYVAMSFTRDAKDVIEMRNFLHNHGGEDIEIIAKIENRKGVDNIDDIIKYSDGIMVARGDMGVEISFEELPGIQKNIIKKCYRAGKKVITATQMLESMIHSPIPTRAEISDVANAVYDGTSATMLSGETSVGEYNIEAVKTMASIITATEKDIHYKKRFSNLEINITKISDAVSHATCSAAQDLNAAAILVVTQSGTTARMVSSFRPATPIIAATTSIKAYYKLALSWGVTPILAQPQTNTDILFNHAVECAKNAELVKTGDLVVITAGVPVGISGNTNILKIDYIQ